MEELTRVEERIMQIIWDLKKCFVKDIIEAMDETPKPPYNTISSVVRILTGKGYLSFKSYGKTYEYFPLISKDEYRKNTFNKVLSNYFGNSTESLLSFMVKEQNLTIADIDNLKKLIDNQPSDK